MNKCQDILKIVRGNGFTLCLQVEARRTDGTAVEGFALHGDEVLKLLHNGTAETKAYERVDNSIFVTFDGTDELGWYGLEMTGVYADEPWRWCVPKVFQIVETNERANLPSWTFLADDTYIVGCGITLLTSVCQADWDEESPTAPSYIKNKPDLSLFYQKPTGGIPASDLSDSVNQSLHNGDDALDYIQRTADYICSGNRSEIAPTLQEACDKASGAVRFDIEQSLSDQQKETARANISAYTKPTGGIPYNDLANDVKQSLIHADAALQAEDVGIVYHDDGVPYVSLDIAGDETMIITSQPPSGPEYHTAPSWVGAEDVFEQKYLKVTSVSASSTNSQYPSAKCVYDLVGDVATLLAAI